MGYFQGEKLKKVVTSIENTLVNVMNNINSEEGLINSWSFDEKGNVLLFQERKCGCNKLVGTIPLDIKKEELSVLSEEEFVMQVEDMLLEVNDNKGYDNLLFNVEDYKSIVSKCSDC